MRNVIEKLLSSLLIFCLTTQSSWPLAMQITVPASEPLPQKVSVISGQSVTMLANGNWLQLGGQTKNGSLQTASIVNAKTGQTVVLSRRLNEARAWHTATLLPDGTVIVLGGESKSGGTVGQAEIFDPSSLSFRSITTGLTARSHHAATLM